MMLMCSLISLAAGVSGCSGSGENEELKYDPKVSEEKGRLGELLYSPIDLNKEFKARLNQFRLEALIHILLGYRRRATNPQDTPLA